MNVPTFNAQRQAENLANDLVEAARRVLLSGHYILGPEVDAFQEEIARYLDVPHAIGVASGTDALWLALRAIDVGAGDLVLTTPLTFFATASAILNCGATPVMADIEPDSYNLDPAAVARVLAGDDPVFQRQGYDPAKIKALVPVHLYGNLARLDPLLELARERGLRLVEDTAQAMGSTYRGRQAGTLGDIGCYSFFPTKNLGACGDAGLVVTHDDALADRLSALRKHGAHTKYYHELIGTNSRLDALQAALLRAKLPHFPAWLESRRAHAEAYDAAFADTPGVVVPTTVEHGVHSYHQYTLRVEHGRRDVLQAHLAAQGIGSTIYYPVPLHQQQAMSCLGYQRGDFPHAERACAEILSLPMFPEMTADERQAVIAQVQAFCAAQA